jgi:predicted phage-related endonuclease
MGEAESSYIGERKITWKAPKQSFTIDSKKLKEEKPDIYDQYKKEKKATRTFRIASKKRGDNDE